MSKINDLIKKMCPNGVPFKKIGDICETITDYVAAGSFKDLANNVKYLQEPDYAMLIRTTDIKSKFKSDKFIYINESAFNYLWRVNLDKDSLILPNIGNCGEIYYLTPDDLPYKRCALATNAILARSEKINMKYLKHAFLANDFQIQLKKITSPSGQTKFNKTDLKKLLVPVPPIEVQEEIVRILDKFGELEVELEAELEARKSQYEFWRGKLLENSKDKVKFGDIATILRGGSPRPIQNFITTDDSGIPWIKIGDTNPNDKYIIATKEKITVDGSKKSRFVKAGDFILSNSMSFGRPYILKIDGCIHDGWLSISNFEDTYIPDFLYYLLSSKPIQDMMAMKASVGTVKNLNADIVKSIGLPLYTKSEQEKIVRILDKFEELTNDITVGLPAEMELRRKQYEYYRNKLLSFEELSVSE